MKGMVKIAKINMKEKKEQDVNGDKVPVSYTQIDLKTMTEEGVSISYPELSTFDPYLVGILELYSPIVTSKIEHHYNEIKNISLHVKGKNGEDGDILTLEKVNIGKCVVTIKQNIPEYTFSLEMKYNREIHDRLSSLFGGILEFEVEDYSEIKNHESLLNDKDPYNLV